MLRWLVGEPRDYRDIFGGSDGSLLFVRTCVCCWPCVRVWVGEVGGWMKGSTRTYSETCEGS